MLSDGPDSTQPSAHQALIQGRKAVQSNRRANFETCTVELGVAGCNGMLAGVIGVDLLPRSATRDKRKENVVSADATDDKRWPHRLRGEIREGEGDEDDIGSGQGCPTSQRDSPSRSE